MNQLIIRVIIGRRAFLQACEYITTLSVSPLKNAEKLNTIGLSLENEGCKWLPSDFKKRNGYLDSINLSKKYGLYRQDYCGCKYSKR